MKTLFQVSYYAAYILAVVSIVFILGIAPAKTAQPWPPSFDWGYLRTGCETAQLTSEISGNNGANDIYSENDFMVKSEGNNLIVLKRNRIVASVPITSFESCVALVVEYKLLNDRGGLDHPRKASIKVTVNYVLQKNVSTPSVRQYHQGQGGSYSGWKSSTIPLGWEIVPGSSSAIVKEKTATGGGVQFTRIEARESPTAVRVRAYAQPTSRHHGVSISGYAEYKIRREETTTQVLRVENSEIEIELPKEVAFAGVLVDYANGEREEFTSSGSGEWVKVEINLKGSNPGVIVRKQNQQSLN